MIQAQVLNLIGDLVRERGIGMIMISHDLSVLSATCQRLAVMYAGRIVEEGPARQVFTDARHPYAEALAWAFPIIGDIRTRMSPRGLPGDPPDPAAVPSGCSFHPRCAVAQPQCSTRTWSCGRPVTGAGQPASGYCPMPTASPWPSLLSKEMTSRVRQ